MGPYSIQQVTCKRVIQFLLTQTSEMMNPQLRVSKEDRGYSSRPKPFIADLSLAVNAFSTTAIGQTMLVETVQK